MPWSVDTTPWDFGHELLPEDIDRIAPSLEVGFRHFPALQNAGIKRILNGPFTFAPDGNPLVGPVRGHDGFWVACGGDGGVLQGGGVGLALANWMIDGDPGVDAFAMDVARYGAWATRAYTHDKVKENYSRRFSIRYPNEELPAARPLRTTPVHDRLCEAGAQFGDAWGLEVPLWFAPPGVEDVFSWHRSVDFEHVGAECRAVREGVGLSGHIGVRQVSRRRRGRARLARPRAGRPRAQGGPHRARAHAQGGRQADRRFHARQSRPARLLHRRFRPGRGVPSALVPQHLPDDGSVELQALGTGWCGLSIAGPASRAVLQSVTAADVSAEAFKFMTSARSISAWPRRWSDASPSPAISATRSGAAPTTSATCTTC